MQNAVSGVLASIAKEVLSLEGGIGKLSKAFEGLNRTSLAMGGGLAFLAGGGILLGFKKLTDQAKELSHELTQIQKLGAPAALQNAAVSQAFAGPTKVPGTTTVDWAKSFGQTYSMFGNDAVKMQESILRFGQVLGSQSGNFDKAQDRVLSMIRAGDLMGKFVDSVSHQVDVDKLQRFLDLGTKVITATHSVVSPETWFALAQQGGPALSGMTDEGLLTMAIAAQAMKGPRAGTALTSLYSQMVGGRMLKFQAEKLEGLGVVGPHEGKGLSITWPKESLNTPFAEALKKDPMMAVEILKKALEAHGFNTIDKQVPELFQILGKQTTQRLIHDLLRNQPQVMAERGRIMQGAGITGAANLQNSQDFMTIEHNMMAAWSDMLSKIGLPATQAAIPILQQLTKVFLDIGQIASTKEGAENIKMLVTGVMALGAALLAGGGVALLAALGPAGWIAAGITALGIACITYQDQIKSVLTADLVKSVMDSMDKVSKAITDGLQKVIDWLVSWIPGWMIQKSSYQGGGFGEGGSFQRASYGGSAGSFGGGTGGGGGSDPRGLIPYIRQQAALNGVDPDTAVRVARSEGLGTFLGDHGMSGGAFQLYTGGGLGNTFRQQTGLNPLDPANEKATIAFAMQHAGRTHDWGPWHGAARVGIGRHQGFNHPSAYRPSDNADKKQELHVYLDGKHIHANVVKRMVAGLTHPVTGPYHDGSRHWTPPDAGLVGV